MLTIEEHGDVRLLRWADGENRFNLESLAALHGAVDELVAIEGPLAIVLTGDGKFFSNGLDLDWMGANPGSSGQVVDEVHRLFGRIMSFSAITVAAVNGHAFAGGAMLATCFDYVVMRDDRGYWCLPEADLGLPLTDPMFAVISSKLPRRTTQEAILTGRRWDAAQALAAGIVHHTAAEADVVAKALELATVGATKKRNTIEVHKQQLFGDALRVINGG